MKIPGLDTAVFQTVRWMHRLGKIRTIRDLNAVRIDGIHSILIVVTTALGDSVTFTPALTSLRKRYPKARIVGLYHKAYSALYEDDPRFDRIIPYYGKYRRLRQTISALREESCELALLPYMNDPDVIPLVLAGGSKILFRMPGRNTVYSFLVVHPELLSSVQPPDHANVRGANMVKYLDCAVSDFNASLHRSPDSAKRVDAVLGENGLDGNPLLIGFHPGASIPEKRWPVPFYRKLSRLLLEKFPDARILVTGSPAERQLCGEISQKDGTPRIFNLAGNISIKDMPELLGRLGILILGDTGVSHMAYAVRCPTLTLFWRTDHRISGPVEAGGRHRLILAETAEGITPEKVFSEAVDHLCAFRLKNPPGQ